ncbi:MAG: hypothetical protein A2W35_00025 [Chloroflexi bacterium RBG_16_57_11]|nr:MAG: hypothetical protein A2W35_00025 [Chloroflexi bacterium RBG_16_57_11]
MTSLKNLPFIQCFDVKIMPMKHAQTWLRRYAFPFHVTAFLLMLTSPTIMVLAAQRGTTSWIYPPLALFIFANLLELFIP